MSWKQSYNLSDLPTGQKLIKAYDTRTGEQGLFSIPEEMDINTALDIILNADDYYEFNEQQIFYIVLKPHYVQKQLRVYK